ncbi:MAG: ammonium transporter, partial [Polyangiaceae bacterium]|nr:ammonium transporter [Polyangiaceae bacterium]
STNPDHSFVTQLIGVGVYAVFSVVCAGVLFYLTKMLMGLRVDAEEETEGLDFGEHGMHAYDFGRGGASHGTGSSDGASSAAAYSAEPATSNS